MEPNDSYLTFLAIWHEYMWYLFLAAIGLSVLTVIAYHIRYASQSNYKTKYDLVSQSETATYLRANYFLAVGIFLLINTVYDETVALSGVWFFIRMFISVCISTLHIYIAYLVFNYYYQGPLNKK